MKNMQRKTDYMSENKPKTTDKESDAPDFRTIGYKAMPIEYGTDGTNAVAVGRGENSKESPKTPPR